MQKSNEIQKLADDSNLRGSCNAQEHTTIPWIAFVFLILLCVGCDQLTKAIAKDVLVPGKPVSMVGEVVIFQLSGNSGAFLSLGSEWPLWLRRGVFVILIPVGLVGVAVLLLKFDTPSRRQTVGLALVIGGGASNWLDRVFNGGVVVDFLNLGIGGLRTGIFNVADTCILFGAVLIVWRRRGRPEIQKEGEQDIH